MGDVEIQNAGYHGCQALSGSREYFPLGCVQESTNSMQRFRVWRSLTFITTGQEKCIMKMICTVFMGIMAVSTVFYGTAQAGEDASSNDEYVSTADMVEPLILESEQDDRHTHVRAFPLVNHKRHGESTQTKFVHVPGAALVKTRGNAHEEKVEILDVPFFTLAESKSRDNGEFDNKAIDIPIFGPLFRHKREGDREKVRFLIFSHTRTVDPEKYEKRHNEREPRQGRSRGKASRN
jgi:hypothetical protein